MESIGQSEASTEFVTADELRDMTISAEDRFERDRQNILTALMDSMVKLASENGVFNYVANLNPKFDPVLLTTISKDLEELGYKVVATTQKQEPIGEFIALDVSWAKDDKPLTEVASENN